MIKYVDKKNKFYEIFNPKNGFYMRSGIIEDNKDTGVDPFMRNFPGLLDIGIMGHCVHGASGLCAKSGVQCYQNGLKTQIPNMTFENFKRIVNECKNKTFQFALGGRGDVDQHENFEDIVKYCRDNGIVPNFTSSGLGFTDEIVDICKKYCGAVAISMYSRLDNLVPEIAVRKVEDKKVYTNVEDIPVKFTFGNLYNECKWDAPNYIINNNTYNWDDLHHMRYSDEPQEYEYYRVFNEKQSPNYTIQAVKKLIDSGVKTNIHYVLGKNTIDEAIIRLKYNGFPKGINAVVFLLHKPVGLGQESNVLEFNDPKVKEFFNLIDTQQFDFKIGFDSCTVPALINMTSNINEESIDTCEGGRWSAYITSDMKMLPCSFDNQDLRWAYDISNDTVENAWNSKQFEDFRDHFKNSCKGCSKRNECRGGCPIRRQIVLCNKKEKYLYESQNRFCN